MQGRGLGLFPISIWCSVSLHLALLLGVFLSWIRRKIKIKMGTHLVEQQEEEEEPADWCLLTSLVLALYNCGSCCFHYFFGLEKDANSAVVLDSFVRSLASMSMYIYLSRTRSRFPLVLRIWWWLYFTISCCSLAFDLIDVHKRGFQSLVSNLVFVVTGSIFCYASVLGGRNAPASLERPLLHGSSKEEGTDDSSVGFLSRVTFSWLTPLISTGYNKVLDLEDVPHLGSRDCAKGSFSSLKSSLNLVSGAEISHLTTPQLMKSMLHAIWGDILYTGFLALVYTLATYVGPYLIEDLVRFLNGRRRYKHQGYVLVSAFFVGKLVECVANIHCSFRLQRVGVRIRSALTSLIYEKGLGLKQGQSTSGEMINLMAVDAPSVSMSCTLIHYPWQAFVQVVLALLILCKNLGWAATVVALVATLLVMLVNYPLASRVEKAQGKLMELKDKRMKATTEAIQNMKILKLQAWEMRFLSKVSQLRDSEAHWLKKYLYTNAMSTAAFWDAPTFVSVVTFVACWLMGIPLEAGKILSAIATFRILSEPIQALPGTISMFLQTKVSLDRIASFLRLEDLEPDVVERLPRAASEVAVEISGGAFGWDSDPSLRDINVKISHGTRVAVCGSVGSGKSSLLSSMLGEVPKVSGIVRVSGSTAYVAQSAWIQSGKIVDNILFGSEMDRGRYESVLEACALKKDLEALPSGDETVVGERGINLSGGQKQRIQIARALYQDADIYLFDDPFSAVDAHTGTHLFKECLLGLLESKTVIFVTHQVLFLPSADLILVMKGGLISQAGKYNDILTSGSDFMQLVGAHEKALAALDSDQAIRPSSSTTTLEKNGDEKASHDQENADDPKSSQHEDKDDKKKAQLVKEEEREKGRVSFHVYLKYLRAAYGGALVPLILLAHISFQVLQMGSNYWMVWAAPASFDDTRPNEVDPITIIVVFVGFGIGGAICMLLRETLLSTVAHKTSTILFNKMLHSIFSAPMAFFDATPSGRILNRASSDQNAVDTRVPLELGGVAFSTIQLLAVVIIMSQVAWQIFAIFIPIACICVYFQRFYAPASRELYRLVGVNRAPVMQHFSESISGTTTIRGFDQKRRFQDKCMELIDAFSRSYFHTVATQEWLCFRLDLLSSLTFACSLAFLISIPTGSIDTGIAGLAVTYGLTLNMLQVSVIWHLCQLENKIVSVERILQYTDIPSEGRRLSATEPAPSWPSHGEVHIHDLQVCYAPHLPMVLKGISCTFHGGTKTGIVGRTGSGKSTLIQALFRIVEPASGRIVIDGVDISMLGLHDLRSRLSIIPQEPTMFEGTIRNNLDPLNQYTDEQIWQAIDKCELGDEVRKKGEKLDSLVVENGENWSMGQRQLVCLARVLLRKSKILVLDEATASVDTATDGLIQRTIRHHFSGSTVLIIAHRITSVLDSDRVLVLSQGVVEECDSPTRLLEEKDSSFAKLVAEYTSRSGSRQH